MAKKTFLRYVTFKEKESMIKFHSFTLLENDKNYHENF